MGHGRGGAHLEEHPDAVGVEGEAGGVAPEGSREALGEDADQVIPVAIKVAGFKEQLESGTPVVVLGDGVVIAEYLRPAADPRRAVHQTGISLLDDRSDRLDVVVRCEFET